MTAVALLAESHISIHTWPEKGMAVCDVFTCGATYFPKIIQLTCMKQQVPMTLNLKLLKGPMIDYSPIPDYNEILNYYYTKSQLTKKKKILANTS